MQNIHISYGGSSHVRCYLFLSVTSFSVIATLFDVVSCIFKLKDFSCSNSVMLHPSNSDDSIGGILLGNNNESDNPHFFFMNPFLSFKTRVFFSEEKLESYSYVLISFIFDYYLVSHSAYIFLYFFLSNSKLFDSLLGKG